MRNVQERRRFDYLIICILSIIVTITSVVLIAVLQSDEYHAVLDDRFEYINATTSFCKVLNMSDIDIISTPIAFLLICIFAFLSKRRSLCRKKCKWPYLGLPQIIGVFSKRSRFESAIVYGAISLIVFNIINQTNEDAFAKFEVIKTDPTGLLRLFVRIFKVLMIGLSNYTI